MHQSNILDKLGFVYQKIICAYDVTEIWIFVYSLDYIPAI